MTTGNDDPSAGGDEGGPRLFGSTAATPRRRPRAVAIGAALAVLGLGAWLGARALRPPAPKPDPAPRALAPAPPLPADAAGEPQVAVAGATFAMGTTDGDPDEQPVTQVTVAPFLLDRYEVTVRAYARCVEAGKCTPPDTGMYCNWQKAGREEHPINCVERAQAVAYCMSLGKRLPTEEEWELAARGAEGRKYPWGGAAPAAQLCWNGEGSDLGKGQRQGTCRIGSYPAGASPTGLLDLGGNVWEMTDSAYCPYGKARCGSEAYVIRGGSWSNLDPAYVRASDRARQGPKARPDNVGFRCAKSPP